jgi:hypothetical protein
VLKFDSQVAFATEDFKKFDRTFRADKDKLKAFFKKFVPEFKLSLYGVDIVIDERDGRHLIIDCNYFSSYTGIDRKTLGDAFKNLV